MTTNKEPRRKTATRVAVFNIDGCISDDRWRRGRVPAGASQPADFKAYHDGASDDPPLKYGAAILASHIANGDFIVFATGRDVERATDTSEWIRKHFGIIATHDFLILMRGPDDHRPTVELKRQQAEYVTQFCTQESKTCIAAYDNRRDVVAMYKEVFPHEPTLLNEDGEFVIADEFATMKTPEGGGALVVGSEPDEELLVEPAPLPPADHAVDVEKLKKIAADMHVSLDNIQASTSPREIVVDWSLHSQEGELTNAQKYPQYFKDVRDIDEIDVYMVLDLFDVNSHPIGHAIKKLLLAGVRTGGKSQAEDIKEARDTLNRWLQIYNHRTA